MARSLRQLRASKRALGASCAGAAIILGTWVGVDGARADDVPVPAPLPISTTGVCPNGALVTISPAPVTTTVANAIAAACSGTGVVGQTVVQQATQANVAAVRSQNENIRDAIQRRQSAPVVGRPIGFAPAPELSEDTDSPWRALAYDGVRDSKSPAMKAPAMPMPAASGVRFATWAQGYADREDHSGTFNNLDVGRKTNTFGGIGGGYWMVPVSGDTFVVGIFGSGTESRTSNNDGTSSKVTGPGMGVNAMYIRGGFSADATFQANFFGLNTSTPGFTGLGIDTVAVSTNVQYKFDFSTWWIEPTLGTVVTDSYWDGVAKGLGFINGHQVRVQGGARVGATLANWTGGRVEGILGVFAYNDVKINGGTLTAVAVGTPLIPTDEGKTFGRATGKINVEANSYFSYYVEGEVRGGNNLLGYAGRLGATVNFN